MADFVPGLSRLTIGPCLAFLGTLDRYRQTMRRPGVRAGRYSSSWNQNSLSSTSAEGSSSNPYEQRQIGRAGESHALANWHPEWLNGPATPVAAAVSATHRHPLYCCPKHEGRRYVRISRDARREGQQAIFTRSYGSSLPYS